MTAELPTVAEHRRLQEQLAEAVASRKSIVDFTMPAILRRAEAAEAQVAALREALAQSTREELSMARRMRSAVVEARRRLAKGRALWNGPCHECDAALEEALRADCPTSAERALARGDAP